MKLRKRLPISRACLFAAAALLSVAPKARAANVFFDADNATPAQLGAATVGATGTWSDAFWYNAGPTATAATGDGEIATYIFTAADTAYFQGNKGTLTAAADQIITLNGINDSTGMTLSGGSLLLSGAGANITVNGSVMSTISSVITGTDGLIKAGTGDLKLAAANTYTGVTLINGGQVIVDDAAALGLSTVTVATGGTLNLGGKVITNLVTVSGGTLTGGDLDVGLLSASTGIVSATLSGTAGLTKNTTGSLRLDGLNTFQGNVLVSQGTLIAGHVSALGGGAVTVSGGTLDLGTTTGLANTVTLTGGTLTGGELAADKLVPVAGTVATKLTGSGKLTKTAAGIVTLSGSNDFSGGADILSLIHI
jgi:fibronectin-binding autotransporter adhesin